MDELRRRFAAIDKVAAPDLWTDIERRADVLDAVRPTRPVDPARPAWRTGPGAGQAPAFGGRHMVVLLILVAALIAVLVGALIAGSPRPDDIRTVVVPSLAVPVPGPTAASVQPPRPGAGTWTPAGPLPANAYLQAATVLGDGKVLATGGRNDATGPSHSLVAAELFDAGIGRWTPVASMASGRSVHTATRLSDGRVLVAGGFDDWAALATAEIYDPGTGAWAPTGSMVEARGYHTATLLPDGRVLVTGGRSNNSSTGHALSSAELFDPTTGTWTRTASMSRGRAYQTATLLPDGKVLVAGAGVDGAKVDVTDTAELYDPASGTWTSTGSMTVHARAISRSALDRRGARRRRQRLDARRIPGRERPRAVLGRAVRPGHRFVDGDGRHARPHALSTATVLADGHVLVAGGRTGGHGASSGTSSYDTGGGSVIAELYDPATGAWTETAQLGQRRELEVAVALPDGRVVVAGGLTAGRALASTEVFDPTANP